MKLTLAAVLVVSSMSCSNQVSDAPKGPPGPDPSTSEFRPPAKDFLKYDAPREWVSEKLTDKMRKAQYRVPDRKGKAAPASLTFFNMGRREDEEIVEYWRNKMGGADANVAKIKGASGDGIVVDIEGNYTGDGANLENARFLGAMIDIGPHTWYFKFVGPVETVGGWKDAFVEWLKGVRPIE